MMDDLEQKLKEGLLENLIEHMSNGIGDSMKPKGLAVEVAAPNKDKLAEGLDKAKDVLGSIPEPSEEGGLESEESPDDEESDEERLLKLLSGEDDEDEMR